MSESLTAKLTVFGLVFPIYTIKGAEPEQVVTLADISFNLFFKYCFCLVLC